MTVTDDEMIRRFAHLDPIRRDVPPVPGSSRYLDIKERAIRSQPDISEAADSTVDSTQQGTLHSGVAFARSRLVRFLAVAATVVAALAGIVVLAPAQTESAEATVAAAASATGQVASLRGTLTRNNFNSSSGSAVIEYSDGNARIIETSEEGRIETVVIGDRMYEDRNGETSQSKIEPKQKLAPYGASAASVITAALESAEVGEQERETIGGVETVHYVITLDTASRRALGALTPRELAWFELEYPEEVSHIDVWVANDLVQKIVVHVGNGTATSEFYDFDADIQISPPAWGVSN